MRWEGLFVDCTGLSLRRGHRQEKQNSARAPERLLLLQPVWWPPASAWLPGLGTPLALTHSWCSWLSSSWCASSCGPVWGPIWTTGWPGVILTNPRKSKLEDQWRPSQEVLYCDCIIPLSIGYHRCLQAGHLCSPAMPLQRCHRELFSLS